MALKIDYERLIMTGVLIAALVLWGGIIGEFSGLYPDGKEAASAVLGVFILVFTIFVLILAYYPEEPSEKSNS
ncbi:hypothetical protein U4E84_10470 [Halorubrum sp. AD140]|uniref:hypothetical protein n=1 Tax=Halorubrum sp. AD140 TaxID=3050073 RepID=UPI002ACC9DEF|nr:hypothetical protein [Halorubrum sp. AD140]MDZ5811763.1 hypothetical protein [Halorubrum sp. AD140]